MFVDYITLYFENKSAEILNYNCHTELNNINEWLIKTIASSNNAQVICTVDYSL